MDLNLIFIIELVLQISVVVILGLGLWILSKQIKIANEHFKCIQTLDNQVQQLDKTVKEQYIWNKRSGALAYSLFKSDTLRETKIRLDHEFGTLSITNTLDLKTIKDKIDKKFETEVDIQTVLGHWENMALAISTGVADEDVAFSMVANQVGLYYNSFKEYIDDVRKLYPRRYAKFTWLYKRWKERLAGATPPPIADETTTENQ
jgi:hypothetical protein